MASILSRSHPSCGLSSLTYAVSSACLSALPCLQGLHPSPALRIADLSADERNLVERAYKSGAISVLTATSTVAAGVNLPARRVICQPYVGLKDNLLDASKWRQMAGRAGRAGLDTHGEAILLATSGLPLHRLQLLLQVTAFGLVGSLGEPSMTRRLLPLCLHYQAELGLLWYVGRDRSQLPFHEYLTAEV